MSELKCIYIYIYIYTISNSLIPQDPRTARFYLLPKIHKAGNPGRPIVSGNGSPTERISEFVDSYLNPLVSHIPSYIQDTTDFLRKLEGIKHQIPNSAFLVTLDVSSLYTDIPHDECMCHRSQIQQPNQTFSETPHRSYPTYTDQKQFHVPRQKLSPGSKYSDGH